MTEDVSTTRRAFIGAVVAGGGFLLTAVLLMPGASYVLDPLLRNRKDKKKWRKVATSDLVEGEPVAVSVHGERVDAWTKHPRQRLGTVWLRRKTDKLVALSAECPHLGCQIKYSSPDKLFVCPCHDSSFSLEGTPLKGPSPRSMDPIEVREKDGNIEVRFARFRLQSSDRTEIG